MNKKEADAIISDKTGIRFGFELDGHCFMDGVRNIDAKKYLWSNCLDSIADVWNKIEAIPTFKRLEGGKWKCIVRYSRHRFYNDGFGESGWCDTIQEAAAIATAKALISDK